jgi:hypothetical protein
MSPAAVGTRHVASLMDCRRTGGPVANYPYISGQGGLFATFAQLRKGFPPKVDASYLKRFNIAPANESYVISILRFLDLIDDEGNKVEDKTHFFYGDENLFKQGLEAAMRSAYSQVFSEMGDDALDADRSRLAHWFRASDRTTELVGSRQASTFQTLASLAGHGELPARATATRKGTANGAAPAKKATATKKTAKNKKVLDAPAESNGSEDGGGIDGDKGQVKVKNGQDVGLTVRIEVNLPPGGDADTYDAIFASIKKHLMS